MEGSKAVLLVGTLDTKGAEYAYLRDRLPEHPARVLALDADWPAIARTGAGRPLPALRRQRRGVRGR